MAERDEKLRKAEPSRSEAMTPAATSHPHLGSHKLRSLAASGLGEAGAMQAAVTRMMRTQPEDPRVRPTPHVVVLDDVTRGLGLEDADVQRVQQLVGSSIPEFTQKTQTQRIVHARGRLSSVLRDSMKHVGADSRDEINRRAMAYWRRNYQTDYGKVPTVRYRGAREVEKSGPLPVLLMDGLLARMATAKLPLEKGEARGGKYKRRIPSGNPKHPWRYVYDDVANAYAHRDTADDEPKRVSITHDGDVLIDGRPQTKPLKTADQRRLFASEVGMVEQHELPDLHLAVRRAIDKHGNAVLPGHVREEFTKRRDSVAYTEMRGRERLARVKENIVHNRNPWNNDPFKRAQAAGDLAKGEARGGKYYRRIPTGNAKHPWRYFYHESEYQAYLREQHTHGPDVAATKVTVEPPRQGQLGFDFGAQPSSPVKPNEPAIIPLWLEDRRRDALAAIEQQHEHRMRVRLEGARTMQAALEGPGASRGKAWLEEHVVKPLEAALAKLDEARGPQLVVPAHGRPEPKEHGLEVTGAAPLMGTGEGNVVHVGGHTFPHLRTIKEHGGKWNAEGKFWVVPADRVHVLMSKLPGAVHDVSGGTVTVGKKPAPPSPKPAAAPPVERPEPTSEEPAKKPSEATQPHLDAAFEAGKAAFRSGASRTGSSAAIESILSSYADWSNAKRALMRRHLAGWDAANAAVPVEAPPAPTPTVAVAKAIEGSPRAEAAADAKKAAESGAFVNDRSSKVEQRGEDVMGSARHKAAVWKSLRDALTSSHAETMFTRDFLVRQEPIDFISRVQKAADLEPGKRMTVALNALSAHLALRKFGTKPEIPYETRKLAEYPYEGGKFVRGGSSISEGVTLEEHASRQREHYYLAYVAAKEALDKYASRSEPPSIVDLGRTIRGVYDAHLEKYGYTDAGTEALRSMYNGVVGRGKLSVAGQLNEFSHRVKQKHGSLEAGAAHVPEHALRLLEGASMPAAFDEKGEKKGAYKIDLASMYDTSNMKRSGPPSEYRSVKQALDLLDKNSGGKIGMRAVQWGKSVTDEEREHHLKSLVDSFNDLTDVLGLPPGMASYNGKLAIAVGARGKAGALAHYEPSNDVINLTRASGAGSLAHEWAHFFDYAVGEAEERHTTGTFRGKKGSAPLSQYATTDKGGSVRAQMEKLRMSRAWAELRDRCQSVARDQGMSGKERGYWTSSDEMWARSVERYVQRKLHTSGRENTYLVALRKSAASSKSMWPTDEEVDKLAPMIEAVFKAFSESALLHKAMGLRPAAIAPEYRGVVGNMLAIPRGA